MSPQNHVVYQPKNDDASENDTRPVHRDKRNRHRGWEEREKRADDEEARRDNVAGQAELAEGPGPHAHVLALDALADHEEDGEEVGEEQACNGERDDSVEGRGGANVDQADERGNGGAKEDGAEGKGRSANLRERNITLDWEFDVFDWRKLT